MTCGKTNFNAKDAGIAGYEDRPKAPHGMEQVAPKARNIIARGKCEAKRSTSPLVKPTKETVKA